MENKAQWHGKAPNEEQYKQGNGGIKIINSKRRFLNMEEIRKATRQSYGEALAELGKRK